MGGKGSGRKFRWKAEIVPKQKGILLEFLEDYLIIEDSSEKLLSRLLEQKHEEWYSIEQVVLQRAKYGKTEELHRMLTYAFHKNEKNKTE